VRGDGAGLTLASFRFQREKGETVEVMMLTGGAQCQRAGERTEGTGLGWGVARPWARSGRGLELFPGSSFKFFFFFLFSFFYFSYFFHRFCKNVPNHFKPLSEILQNPCKVFKSIGNKFSRSKQDFFKRNRA
jgi:hypothetical protein